MKEKVINVIAAVAIVNGVAMIVDGVREIVGKKKYKQGFKDGIEFVVDIAEICDEAKKEEKGLFGMFSKN